MDELDLQQISIHWADLLVIGVYLAVILVSGTYLTRLASRGIDSYFLGGRRIPWWLLGVSGTSCYFDVTGVMWTIAFFYIMGQRFMWIQWEWGFAIMLGFFAAYIGKWLRRSKVVTGAEWMNIRFGRGPAGELARTASAILAIVISVAFIGFAEYGCGHFVNKFIPQLRPHTLAIILMTITGVYTIAAGLFGVVLTNVIQFCIILVGSFILIIKAVSMSSYEVVAREVPPAWFGFLPQWNWQHLANWEISEGFQLFILMSLVWVAKGFFLAAGGPQQLYDMQRFLSARSPREACKAGMLWGAALTPMFMVSAAVGVIGIIRWGGRLPHPEHLYPVVIGTMLPIGIKGLVLAGLLSAFMSTFASTVNAGASYLVRDIYNNLLRPKASNRELVRAGRICSVIIIIAGILVGMQAKNIDTIFSWIMMTLGTAVLMPNILRWFWWRFDGFGYAVGTLIGIAASFIVVIFFNEIPIYKTFPVLFVVSTASSILASLLSKPADMETLKDFYRRIRPAGIWKPVKESVLAQNPEFKRDSFTLDLLSGITAAVGFQSLYLVSTYICTKQWKAVALSLVVMAVCAFILYFTWFKHLPDKSEDVELAPVSDGV
ncbi:MAG: sodium:solute symporter family transporter [Planctomycetota bacterium]|jgi:Na+/proline symporter